MTKKMSVNQTRTYENPAAKGQTHGQRDSRNYTWNLSLARSGYASDSEDWKSYALAYAEAHRKRVPVNED